MNFADNLLAPPTNCDNCDADSVVLTTNRDVHGPQAIDPQDQLYFCRRCRACVGVHKGTQHPLGLMADSITRNLRMRAHMAFDPLWQSGRLTRTKAYRLLSGALNMAEVDCHFGLMSRELLLETIAFCRDYQSEAMSLKRRREEKKLRKLKERDDRDFNKRNRTRNRR